MVSALASLHALPFGSWQALPSWRINMPFHHPSFSMLTRTCRRPPEPLRATAAGPPKPPSFRNDDSLSGFEAAFSKIQDRVRIFLAVLFWMSLFFWSSTWDGRDGIRKNKGPKFPK
ncbi:uncharacterized protein LOC120260757 [Dioscorea cayenensis subsp. rotundata]|uniref:Uncharacterized protein LOC120260757 n=1 Tax=Dioscorea cayennensis subsp. rotundata TaxID=55577 RepID=A0AB40BC93_DIOCR|nr:uncharacterized protein LOC120260757 [Dioscorea cayenensis subsp. rotundata]